MHRLAILVALSLLPATASAQSIGLADLQGVTIHTVNTYSGTFSGERGSGPGRVEVRGEIRIGPGDAISWSSSRTVTADGPKGTKTGQVNRSGKGTIGTPQKADGGNVLFVLDGNSLVRMRTLESGGHLLKVTFARTGAGLTCTAQMPMMREVGGGNIKDRGALHSKVEILDIKPTGSSCRVSK